MIILLVEDDTALAMGTTYALESEGMQVIHTTGEFFDKVGMVIVAAI